MPYPEVDAILSPEEQAEYNELLAEIERLERINNEFESAWQGGKAVVGRLGRGARNAALEREHPGLLEELRLQREILNTYEEKARRQAATLAQDRYRRIPGEIEAWDTMERRDLPAAERPGKTPYAGQPGAQAPGVWDEGMESGGGQFQTTPIRITGEELGPADLGLAELRQRARAYAREHFAGKTVTVRSDGARVEIPFAGIRKATSGIRPRREIQATVAIPEMLQAGTKIREEEDRDGRQEVRAWHTYEAVVDIGGKPSVFWLVVRESKDGRMFYDRYEKYEPSAMPGESSPASPLLYPSGTEGSNKNIIAPGEDGVKEKKEDFDHRDTEGTENMPNGGSAVLGLAAMSDGALSEKMEEYRQRVAPLEARSEALAKTVARQKQKMGTTLAERKRRAVDDEMSAIYREYEPFQKEINRRSLRRRVERGEINRLNVHLLSEFQREPWAAGAWERYAGEPAERRKPLAIDLNRWQAEVDALADPYLRSNALEEIADRPIADAQFRQVLDRAPGLPNARRIFYAVFRNPKASAETRTRAWEMHENEPFGATIVSPKDAEAMEKKPPEGGTPERGLIEEVEREEEQARAATAQERATDLFPQEAPSAPVRPRNLMQQGDLFGAPEGASKPPHQMTLLEFFAHQGINYRTASQQKRTNTEKLYKAMLARAIAEGLDISPEAGAVSRDLQNFIENELRKARGAGRGAGATGFVRRRRAGPGVYPRLDSAV